MRVNLCVAGSSGTIMMVRLCATQLQSELGLFKGKSLAL
jgi:hypothetical protein